MLNTNPPSRPQPQGASPLADFDRDGVLNLFDEDAQVVQDIPPPPYHKVAPSGSHRMTIAKTTIADLIATYGNSSATAWLEFERYHLWQAEPGQIPESTFAPIQGYMIRNVRLTLSCSTSTVLTARRNTSLHGETRWSLTVEHYPQLCAHS